MSEPILKCKVCGGEYWRRMLECPKCGASGIVKLYKYVPYNAYSLSILINKEVWFPKACDLNDPFEFEFNLTDLQINGIPIEPSSIATAKEQALKLGTFCLTEVNNNILMWSHYAAQHQGFCIEFERSKENELNGDSCVPVIYPDSDDVPKIKTDDLETNKTFAKIVTTKSKSWKYEAEWRTISKKKGGKHYPLPGKLTAIIYGLRMNSTQRSTIKNILGNTIKYYEAVKSEDKFSLSINSFSDGTQ